MSNAENDRIAETEREKLIEQWADKSWMMPELIEALLMIANDHDSNRQGLAVDTLKRLGLPH